MLEVVVFDWLIQNKEWVFGGVGVAAITGLIALLRRKSNGPSQNQRSGSNSTNVQAGRDVGLNKEPSNSDDGR